MKTSKLPQQVSETQGLGADGLPRKRGRRPVRGVAAGLQLNLNSGAARHAAEQFKQWVQALGGAAEVSPQEATLLRHASYLATYTDALWYQVCVSASNAGFAAEQLSRSAQACAGLLKACGLARRTGDADACAPRLRDLASVASQLASPSLPSAPLATNASPAATQASAASARPTPATSWPPAPLDAQGTPPVETFPQLSDATARCASLPGAPLAFWASASEQPALPGLETPSETQQRKQYLYSSDSELARRLRSERAARAGRLGGFAARRLRLARDLPNQQLLANSGDQPQVAACRASVASVDKESTA